MYLDKDALERVSTIRTEQLKAPEGLDCQACFARVACLGGCHCQYAGQDGTDPADRYGIARGFCESYRAAMTGMVRAGVGASLDQSDGSTRTVYTHAIKRIDRDTGSRFDA